MKFLVNNKFNKLLLFSLNICIFIFKVMLNGLDFIPFTVDPDDTYRKLRNMCANEGITMSCKRFIDVLDESDLPIDNVCNTL